MQEEAQTALPPFAVTTRQLVEQLMTMPADFVVLNAQHLMFLQPMPAAPANDSEIIKPSAEIILPN